MNNMPYIFSKEMRKDQTDEKDFNQLCRLDLSDTGSLRNHIDTLRPLSHGEFKNAYFFGDKSGKKVFS